jgi:cystathionine beta-lyase/cystathionine gamma-synthase
MTHPDTHCSRPASRPPATTEPLVPPLDLSIVYKFDSLDHVDAVYGGAPGFVYARDGHPNAAILAEKVAQLEGAQAATVCASGMAATTAPLLALAGQGDHIACADQVYGRTAVLLRREFARLGIASTFFDATRPESLHEAITPTTKVVLVETISNPLLRVADLPAFAAIAHAAGAKLIVDHTFAPLLCRPLELGADLVYHSATKLIGGHSDLTLGVVAGQSTMLARVAQVASTFGLTGNPFESWLALRGLATLGLRVARTSATALELARRLAADARPVAVHYPGLETHPDHPLASRLLTGGFGAMMTIDLGDRRRADALIRALEHIPFAPSLGDVATTLSHPATTSHRGQDAETWARQGISEGLVRFSVGLEHTDDLWADLDQALAAAS